jgi:hypothetical protein
MQPVAIHRAHPERLLLIDDDSRWFLWLGEPDTEPVEMPFPLATYLLDRREMQPLEMHQRLWFIVSDLPVRQPVLPDVGTRGSMI